MKHAVTFDFGQTLAELDTAMLARRLAERGTTADAGALDRALTGAWTAYNRAILEGRGGHPWKLLMTTLLTGAGVAEGVCPPLVDWLWDEQPRANLWRRPIPGMIEVAIELGRAGVPVAVVSNSEGKLAELADELGWRAHFEVVADSGRLGFEKPGREIFAWTAEKLGVPLDAIVHVGDAWAADFEGALGAGMRAILFRGQAFVPSPNPHRDNPRAAFCTEAHEVRDVLARWGFPLTPRT